jgi:hypothetical protein
MQGQEGLLGGRPTRRAATDETTAAGTAMAGAHT